VKEKEKAKAKRKRKRGLLIPGHKKKKAPPPAPLRAVLHLNPALLETPQMGRVEAEVGLAKG